MTEAAIPEDLRYTREHEWVQRTGDTRVRIGITDYAQKQLDDVVFVQLPDSGAAVTAGEPFGEVESTKSVSDIFSPISGRVIAVNDQLGSRPELVNASPYKDGWLVELEVADTSHLESALSETLDAAGYREIITD
ncbi:glycine cleavage system protein GcvH [Hoyosella sp. YIM 151337]|uniref:glycine cleavage system protein GcvH n=1 Tax=Hoyosella sp. YIM 151337 TaxID=2992742 RepID=UPI0022355CBC|nr:glycine cleavage system protein GcvH [Hoyosella sp. YIM 151337]MCW4354500.1 glycine cleavage system protein GcvH [Hoyosella sp. YIM 151337]